MASNCPHPLCKQMPHWYPGGPTLKYFPLPIPDPACTWGSTDCSKCQGKICYGHYLSPTLSLFSPVSPMVRPPSQILKDAFSDQKSKDFSDSELAKTTLLPPEEVCMWLEHLKVVQDNRRRGAAKASATRRLKKSQDKHFCICGEEYLSLTDEVQSCDSCSNWFHFECVGINPAAVPECFLCHQCSS